MRTTTAVCVLLLAEGLSSETAWAQTRPRTPFRLEAAHASVNKPASKLSPARPSVGKPSRVAARTARPAKVTPSYLLRTPAPDDPAADLRIRRLLPSYTRERTAFTTQSRVPVAEFWDGRVQLACFHQRTRGANFYSAVPRSDMPSVALPANAMTPGPRGHESYGGGVWLRLGRSRTAPTAAARPGQSSAPPVH